MVRSVFILRIKTKENVFVAFAVKLKIKLNPSARITFSLYNFYAYFFGVNTVLKHNEVCEKVTIWFYSQTSAYSWGYFGLYKKYVLTRCTVTDRCCLSTDLGVRCVCGGSWMTRAWSRTAQVMNYSRTSSRRTIPSQWLLMGGLGGEGVFVFNYDSESQLETENSAGAKRFVILSDPFIELHQQCCNKWIRIRIFISLLDTTSTRQ